jgi:hypothetical protein
MPQHRNPCGSSFLCGVEQLTRRNGLIFDGEVVGLAAHNGCIFGTIAMGSLATHRDYSPVVVRTTGIIGFNEWLSVNRLILPLCPCKEFIETDSATICPCSGTDTG